MGFRCPYCGKDFGNNREVFDIHIKEVSKCSTEALYELTKIEFTTNILVEKKARKIDYTTPGMYKTLDINTNNIKRDYDFIGNHDWQKINIVSHEDGSDTIKCKKCGLTASRLFDVIKPNKRFSANKIENCDN